MESSDTAACGSSLLNPAAEDNKGRNRGHPCWHGVICSLLRRANLQDGHSPWWCPRRAPALTSAVGNLLPAVTKKPVMISSALSSEKWEESPTLIMKTIFQENAWRNCFVMYGKGASLPCPFDGVSGHRLRARKKQAPGSDPDGGCS